MFESLQPLISFAWDLGWQSSLVLALVLALEFLVRLRPARGHRVLALAMIAALAAPLLSQQAHRLGWDSGARIASWSCDPHRRPGWTALRQRQMPSRARPPRPLLRSRIRQEPQGRRAIRQQPSRQIMSIRLRRFPR